jgi:predicted lipase
LDTLTDRNSELDTDVTGYVAVDHSNRLVVVSFRGSYSLDNWITNLKMDLTKTVNHLPTTHPNQPTPTNLLTQDICPGCTAHRGFWQSWLDARSTVLPAIKTAVQKHTGYKLVMTGHSLGGAIATLAAAQLRNSGYPTTLYSFGAPRIGGPQLSEYITKQSQSHSGSANYRVTHWNDPVPRLPPLVMGYVHVSPEYYIERANLQGVGPRDVRVCVGSTTTRGNAGWLVTDLAAHVWYFSNVVGKCGVFG